MKLVLTSSLFEEGEIFENILRQSGKEAKEISVAVLIEAAAVEKGDKRWLIDGLASLSKVFGGEIDVVNLLALDKEEVLSRLAKADVVFCFGGSSEWLKIVFDKTGFANELPTILNEKVWIGSSAGSMILGRMPSENIQTHIYGEIDFMGVSEYLNFVDFVVMPHIWGEYAPADAYEWCVEESKNSSYPIYVLSDTAAVVVDGENIKLIGKKACKLVLGKIEEEIL